MDGNEILERTFNFFAKLKMICSKIAVDVLVQLLLVEEISPP